MSQMKLVLQERLDTSTHDRQMYWAAFTTAFFGTWNLWLRAPAIVTRTERYHAMISQLTVTSIGCTSKLLKQTRSAWASTYFLDTPFSLSSKGIKKLPGPSQSIRSTAICIRRWVLSHSPASYLYALVSATQIGVQRRPLRRSQLLDQSSNNCSRRWPARLADQNSSCWSSH